MVERSLLTLVVLSLQELSTYQASHAVAVAPNPIEYLSFVFGLGNLLVRERGGRLSRLGSVVREFWFKPVGVGWRSDTEQDRHHL